ncbi:MAG TPA: hypothetical protein VFH14_00580 [Gemmatimonadaceae bacterium]|nr:hypothetical protein [Gemmatimonadaceae bacterium]
MRSLFVRSALVALVFALLPACGTPAGTVLSGGETSATAASSRATRTPPPDDPSLKGCMADWFEGYRSLPPLVDRADVIVRATALSSTTSAEMWGVGYRTTLRVDRVLKGSPATTLTVLESACPVVHGGPKDWLLFLAQKPDDPSVFQVPGGLQGAFPIVAGRITPVYSDGYLVRLYTGVDAAELEREVRAVAPIDGDAAARLRSVGWTVAEKRSVQAYELRPAQEFGETRLPPRYEIPFEGYSRVAAVTGLDLRPFGGKEIQEFQFFLERLTTGTFPYPPIAHLMYADRRYLGGWVQIDGTQVFRLEDRAGALAATPQPVREPIWPNRYPGGVNVVAEYGLAGASSIYTKPLDRTVSAPQPALSDVVRALDRTFPTETPPARAPAYWPIGFVLGENRVVFEYYPATGLLVQREDGYAIRLDPAFARLIGAATP